MSTRTPSQSNRCRASRRHSALAMSRCCESLEARRLLSVEPGQAVLPGTSPSPAGSAVKQTPDGFVSLAESLKDLPVNETGAGGSGGFTPIRVRSSRPGAPVTVYLDFDGEAPFYWTVGG